MTRTVLPVPSRGAAWCLGFGYMSELCHRRSNEPHDDEEKGVDRTDDKTAVTENENASIPGQATTLTRGRPTGGIVAVQNYTGATRGRSTSDADSRPHL